MKIATSLTAIAMLGTLLAPAVSQDKPAREVAASASPGTGTLKEVIRATGVIQAVDLEKHHVTIKDSKWQGACVRNRSRGTKPRAAQGR